MHWSAEFVGKRHVIGGRGPEEFDCWGLLRWVYQHRFSIQLPDLPGISAASALTIAKQMDASIEEEWIDIDEPFDGCAVAMSQGKAYHHVGIYIVGDGPAVLHCWDGASVIVENEKRLKLKGLRTIDYFKHRQWPTS